MRCTAVVLREVFNGQAEVFQFLFHLTECPLDFLRCVHNLYGAGERVVVQRKRLLDLHHVVSGGEEDRAASSVATSQSVKPAGPEFLVCRHGLIGEQRLLWHPSHCYSLTLFGGVYPSQGATTCSPKGLQCLLFGVAGSDLSVLLQLYVNAIRSYYNHKLRNAATQHVCCLHFQEITWSSSLWVKF